MAQRTTLSNRVPFRLSDITTRRPNDADASSGSFASISLGGTTLYASKSEQLEQGIRRIEQAIDHSARAHLLLARNMLEKLTRDRLGEALNDRVYGAVLGKMLRLAQLVVVPCLTVNARVMRMYMHCSKLGSFDRKLDQLRDLLKEGTALSSDAAQAACFPGREWGTNFAARQMLAHLSYLGEAVFVDQDLFASSRSSLEHAAFADRA